MRLREGGQQIAMSEHDECRSHQSSQFLSLFAPPIAPHIATYISRRRELYIANNKITEIKGLDGLVDLKTIDLGANRLRSMEGLGGLTNLEALWLGKNKITKIVGLENLKGIRKLDVQSNRLTSVEGLTGQVEKVSKEACEVMTSGARR